MDAEVVFLARIARRSCIGAMRRSGQSLPRSQKPDCYLKGSRDGKPGNRQQSLIAKHQRVFAFTVGIRNVVTMTPRLAGLLAAFSPAIRQTPGASSRTSSAAAGDAANTGAHENAMANRNDFMSISFGYAKHGQDGVK